LVWSKPGTNYLGSYLGLVLVTWIVSTKNQWKFLSLMDDIVRPTLIFSSLLIFDEWLRTNFYLRSMIFLVLLIIDIFFVSWLKKRYRSFSWYKSGKKGFVLLFNGLFFFLTITIVLIILKDNILSIVLALIISLISGGGLYILKKIKI
jgi:glucose uptake protein GlcU